MKHQKLSREKRVKRINNTLANYDYLQVLAYMFRFDAKKAFYFYPEAADQEDKELRLNRGSTFEDNVVARDDVSLIKHGLKIPQNTINYQDFEIKIKDSEIEFMKLFNMVGGKKV